jgi:hypothetical protein
MRLFRFPIVASLIVLWGITAACPLAKAAFIFHLQEDGIGDVIGTGSGSINTSALTAVSATISIPVIGSAGADLQIGTPNSEVTGYVGCTGPTSFGTGTVFGAFGSGDFVGIIGLDDKILLPTGYVSGTPLLDSAEWQFQSFASLDITPGTYTWTWGTGSTADSLTVTTVAVPEPGLLSLLLFGGLALLHRRPSLEEKRRIENLLMGGTART